MKKKKFAVTAAALAMAAVTVFSVGQNYVYADTSADIAAQAEVSSESVVLPVSVSSEAWAYKYGSKTVGTWKALNIKVNDTMYPLSKNGAVSITFNNGDEIKIYAGDSYELWEGTISISGGEVKVKSQNNKYSGYTGTTSWGCNLVYSDGTLTFSKTKNGGTNGNAIFYSRTNVSYKYDLTAKEQDGTPIEGVSVVQDETPFSSNYTLGDYLSGDYIKEHPCEWGNGNSFDVIYGHGGAEACFKSVGVTNQNGYTDMYLPKEFIKGEYQGGSYPDIYVGGVAEASFVGASNARLAYIGNGLVDVTIDDGSFTNTAALGLEPTFGAVKTDEILGDYYYAWKEPQISSGSVTLKDTAGNDIAVVTMGIKETAETHLIGGKEGKSYKATGMEPTVDIKMADGVTDWTVSVTEDDNNNTLHINAVKSNTAVSSDSYTVNLGAAQTISADTFAAILAENATKDVVIKSGNDVTFTFAKGTMANVAGKTEYDFSTSINSIYADTMPAYVTKDNFISQINYNYSGKLPATANIRFYAGTQYAGQTLYYSLMNADNTFAEVQAVVVDADGYMTVKQDHCSSYVVTKTEPKLPSNDDTKTDDGNISNNGGSSDNGNTSNNDGSSNNGNASALDKNASSGNTTVSTDKNASSTNTSATSPKTGDMTPIAIYVVMAVAAIGVIVFVKRRKTA